MFLKEWLLFVKEIRPCFADSDYQMMDNQSVFHGVLKVKLVSPIHLRDSKEKRVDARGVDHIDKYRSSLAQDDLWRS
ncbi:hypothetical protein CN617_31175 [Bacillus wiedmannii]|nr:hypothetical protein CN617_31175 [Bacillus wiedmannii]